MELDYNCIGFVQAIRRRLDLGRTIDPKVFLCRRAECLVAKDGQSLYRDDHHLTVFGALQLVGRIWPTFEEAIPALTDSRKRKASDDAHQPEPEDHNQKLRVLACHQNFFSCG